VPRRVLRTYASKRSEEQRRQAEFFNGLCRGLELGGYIHMSNDNLEKRILPVCTIHQDGKYWPFIRLQGRWLQRLGFAGDSMIEVEYSPGLLLIRLLPRTPREWSDVPKETMSAKHR